MSSPPDAATHLLVVDDNEISREVVTELLGTRGYRVTTANHGREALDILAGDSSISLVLMDVEMPVMGGIEATRALRAEPRWRQLPVVGLTAHAGSADRALLLEAGMDDVVVKPARLAQLAAAVQRNLAGETRPPPSSSPEARAHDALFERQGLLATVEGDADFMAEILTLFLDDMPSQLTELQGALTAADRESVRRRAHAIKGASSNVSAPAMREAARQLEEASAGQGELRGPYDALEATWRQTRARLREELS